MNDETMNTNKKEEEQAQELLLERLQSQFGDIDLSGLMTMEATSKSPDRDDSEESSLEEPTEEELKAWQEAQFQRGAQARKAQQLRNQTPGQRAAQALKERRQQSHHCEDWEELHTPPSLHPPESLFFSSDGIEIVGPHPLLANLAACDPEILSGTWRRLYSSATDGLSFLQLWTALQGYDGPTVVLIGTVPSPQHCMERTVLNRRGTLGFCTATPWKLGTAFYGSNDCFLFRMDPDHNITTFRPTGKKNRFMYSHSNTLSTTSTSNHPVSGLGVGGSLSQPRLHVTEELENCRALAVDETFEAGDLIPNGADSLYYFDVDALEVWGVGGAAWIEQALQAQSDAQKVLKATKRKVQRIDKTQLMDDFRSGVFQSEALFGHAQHIVGRVDDTTDCRFS